MRLILRKTWLIFRLPLAIILCGPLCATSHASIVLDTTRLIYREGASSISILASNSGNQPSLVEARILDDSHKPTGKFLVVPPISRVDPAKAQHFRIFLGANDLPSDRESLFWFTALDIPPKISDGDTSGNYVQFAVRSNLKLFYRPKGLRGNAEDAARHISWRVTGRNMTLVNNSDFYVTVTSIQHAGNAYTSDEGPTVMVSPRSSLTVHVGKAADEVISRDAGPAEVEYEYIDDFGASRVAHAKLDE